MGIFPRVTWWNDDDAKDLLIGTEAGEVRIYLNVGTDAAPIFDEGAFLQVGPPGEKENIYLVCSGTPVLVDWDEDGRRDLLMGAGDARFHLFLNEGTDHEPDYREEFVVQGATGDLMVFVGRSSPTLTDLDGNGLWDIVSGDVSGLLNWFPNRGEPGAPAFDFGYFLESASVPVDLPDYARTRPCVCDWTGDGEPDLVVGALDGMIHLYEGQPFEVAAPDLPAAPARLLAPWPNPANPAVTLAFTLESETRIALHIHDPAGRRVATVAEGVFGAGNHERVWRGEDDAGRSLSSGVYLARLEAAGGAWTRKVVLLR